MANVNGSSAAVTRLHAKVHGHVQGVGYRYWLHHTAGRFGQQVTGSVHNLPDGAVDVEAESPDRMLLEALLIELHQGPSAAQVEKVEAEWEESAAPRYSGAFRVA